MRLEGREPPKNNHKAAGECGSRELQGRTEKEKVDACTKSTHTHTRVYAHTQVSKYKRCTNQTHEALYTPR